MREMDDKKSIERLIYQAFEIGMSKDLSQIQKIHSNILSKFNDKPPYHLQDYNEACLHEEIFFANISDYNFKINDLKIMVFNDIAVAFFIVEEEGMIVDDYSFTGRMLKVKNRVTMVFKKEKDWLIIHEHISRIPEH